MILVDTSVWIDYYCGRPRARKLEAWLEDNEVLVHPWVLAELALGHLGSRRGAVLADLERLPAAPLIPDGEVRALVETRRLYGRGIGWVDAHLLASALVSGAPLWSFDRRLVEAAVKESISI